MTEKSWNLVGGIIVILATIVIAALFIIGLDAQLQECQEDLWNSFSDVDFCAVKIGDKWGATGFESRQQVDDFCKGGWLLEDKLEPEENPQPKCIKPTSIVDRMCNEICLSKFDLNGFVTSGAIDFSSLECICGEGCWRDIIDDHDYYCLWNDTLQFNEAQCLEEIE